MTLCGSHFFSFLNRKLYSGYHIPVPTLYAGFVGNINCVFSLINLKIKQNGFEELYLKNYTKGTSFTCAFDLDVETLELS